MGTRDRTGGKFRSLGTAENVKREQDDDYRDGDFQDETKDRCCKTNKDDESRESDHRAVGDELLAPHRAEVVKDRFERHGKGWYSLSSRKDG